MTGSLSSSGNGLYRAGGFSALVFAVGCVTINGLYVLAGVPPKGGEAWLNYAAGKTSAWWSIIGLSILTDILLVPIALSLYSVLKGFNRKAMLAAIGFVGLFIILDLAVTWPNYTSLVFLSGNYAGTLNEAQRAAYVASANLASAVLVSPIEAVISILTFPIGVLIAGTVMLKGIFGRGIGYLGIATGILGVLSAAGSVPGGVLGMTVVITSILTTIWVLLAGRRLFGLCAAEPDARGMTR
jgi:hypothetical protein